MNKKLQHERVRGMENAEKNKKILPPIDKASPLPVITNTVKSGHEIARPEAIGVRE